MPRGVYFDGWFRHNQCCHPSLPRRTVRMPEDLKRYHADALIVKLPEVPVYTTIVASLYEGGCQDE